MPGPRVQIDVWSDYVCPFCYLEMPELARLAERLGDAVAITWRAFELRPDPVPTLDPGGEYTRRVWNQSVYPMAQARGMVLRLPPVQPRSRKAFEAVAFARDHGRFDAMHEALFQAFFRDGRNLAETAVLQDLAAGAGLDAAALGRALGEGRYTAQVLADEGLAQELGITGVPAMVMGGADGNERLLVSGAQPAAVLEGAAREMLQGLRAGSPQEA